MSFLKREIVLDTETTGLSPQKGDRLVEIGCVELQNYVPTGRSFQAYINPERSMPATAFAVHGLGDEFLKKFPPFREVFQEFLDFIQDAPLVIHNASFDMGFIQAELEWAGQQRLSNPVYDTLMMARQKFPGAPASLDMLCRRFQIDNTHRQKHGALVDAEILAKVYLELSGGLQPDLSLEKDNKTAFSENPLILDISSKKQRREPRFFELSPEDLDAHDKLLSRLGISPWSVRSAEG
jgi:DNA polymerase-3 subunit epsilon